MVFMSDNGTEPGQRKWGSGEPFRGLKWSALEGGTRVPFILRFPSAIPGGEVTDKLTTAIDLLPTLAGACGIKLKDGPDIAPKLDGLNLWASLQGKTKTHPRKSLLYWHGWAMPQAIRVGDFKLYLDKVKEIPGTNNGPVLIDLSKDPREKKDLASEYPEKVKELKKMAIQLLSEIEENSISLGGPVNPKKQNMKGAFWLK